MKSDTTDAPTGRLGGEIALITGSAIGISRATARLIAAEGARVVVADIGGTGAKRVVEGTEEDGYQALAIHVDFTDEPVVARAVAQVDGGLLAGNSPLTRELQGSAADE